MMSLANPGNIMLRPPAAINTRNRGLILQNSVPFRAAATPNRPIREVTTMTTTSSGPVSTSSMAGLKAKI